MVRSKSLRHEHFNRLAKEFAAPIAKEMLRLRIHQCYQTFLVDHNESARRGLDRDAKAFFGALAFRDVDDAGENECAMVSSDRIQSNLNRHFGAIFAQAVQVTPRTHRSGSWVPEESFAQIGMSSAITMRHE